MYICAVRSLKQERDAAENERQHTEAPKLDLAFKEGQTIRINLNVFLKHWHLCLLLRVYIIWIQFDTN